MKKQLYYSMTGFHELNGWCNQYKVVSYRKYFFCLTVVAAFYRKKREFIEKLSRSFLKLLFVGIVINRLFYQWMAY